MKDPILVPIAMPFIAGPGVLAFIMLHPSIGAIVLAWAASAALLLAVLKFKKFISPTLINGLERFAAFILAILATEMIVQGIKSVGGM